MLADVHFGVVTAYARKGYATEAAGELLRYVRDEVGVKDVAAYALPGNVRSWKVLGKLEGMVDRGERVVGRGKGKDGMKMRVFTTVEAELRERDWEWSFEGDGTQLSDE